MSPPTLGRGRGYSGSQNSKCQDLPKLQLGVGWGVVVVGG